MSHPFGDLLSQHLHRRHGLSQSKLAWGIDQNPAIISAMCKGDRLQGSGARERVVRIISWLREHDALATADEANALLTAAELVGLRTTDTTEAALLQLLNPGTGSGVSGVRSAALHPMPATRYTPLALPPTNLPLAVTSFVGRELELAALHEKLVRTHLLTLTGVGGIGKTRLALELATNVRADYPEGVWLVELAPITDPALVPQVVAEAMAVTEQPGVPLLRALCTAMQPRRLLLLLDNCEHVVGAVAKLAEALLRVCPHVYILATTREALDIDGETIYPVPTLRVSDLGRHSLPEHLTQYDAVRLFIDRARTVEPDFQVNNANAPAVAQLCARLDGLPLALELAAARIRTLTVEQIAARLDDRFRLLTGGRRTALPRQQTLRALIDWSYDLLSTEEQSLLRRLSVFAGGWTLESAMAVCGEDEITHSTMLDQLEQLVNKSLVEPEPGPGGNFMRYRLLETIRQYAQEKLDLQTTNGRAGDQLGASAESREVRDRHLHYYTALAEEAEPHLTGARQSEWLGRLHDEYDDIRVALRWAREHDDDERHELALRIVAAMWRFWYIRGNFSEGREQAESVLSITTSKDQMPKDSDVLVALAKAHYGAGALVYSQGDYVAARSIWERGLRISREVGDKKAIADALNGLGNLSMDQTDFPAARSFYEESLALRRELGLKWGIASSLNNLGNIAYDQGDYGMAYAQYEESLSIQRELGDKRGIAMSVNALGNMANRQGNPAAARTLYEESLSIQRDLGDKRGIAYSLANLGNVTNQEGDQAAARTLYEESLSIHKELGDKVGIAQLLCTLGHLAHREGNTRLAEELYGQSLSMHNELGNKLGIAACLVGLGGVAGTNEQPERGAIQLGAAEAVLETIGAVLEPDDQLALNHIMTILHEQLGDEAFAKARMHGFEMSLEQAIAFGMEL